MAQAFKTLDLNRYLQQTKLQSPVLEGTVTHIAGMLIEGTAHVARVGDMYQIGTGEDSILAEVVALKGHTAVLMPYGNTSGLKIGMRLIPLEHNITIPVGSSLLGRVIDALGNPIDKKGDLKLPDHAKLYRDAPSSFERSPIEHQIQFGVKSLDAFTPCGQGQRLGIFAGAGVGKSVLLGMIARATDAEVVVLGLIGERGREVGHFVETILGEEGMRRSVVVASTSDRPPQERVRAALAATAIAEYFRDKGKNVLLFIDSLTRFAMAQREIGLAIGEPPTTKGYPPSVFAQLPKLVERVAPLKSGGSITAIYTVLVEGDDLNDPVADSVRSLLDGHIVLSRHIASRGQYPAVDIVHSLSRLEGDLLPNAEQKAVRVIRNWMYRVDEARDLISMGAYVKGSDLELDKALSMSSKISEFLMQDKNQKVLLQDTREQLLKIAAG